MEIKTKNKFLQLLCNHHYHTGSLSTPNKPVFFNLNGDTYTTICVKCGKIKGAKFIRNWDGS
jgi:hypothetical protein